MLNQRPDGFSEVRRAWESDVVVCIGGGPSLTQEQVDFVRGKARVIAINSAYLRAPWADVLYFADGPDRWYGWHCDRAEFQAFAGEKVTIEACMPGLQDKGTPHERKRVPDTSVHILKNLGVEGLSGDQCGLFNGRNSGYQAINLAVLAGALRIVLLGYDMRHQGGRDHWEGGGHPIATPEAELKYYAKRFATLEQPLKALGVEVVNASPGSALDVFPRIPLDLVQWFYPVTA